MKHLSKLSPAETLLVLLGKETSFTELLKLTMMDLVRKQVLQVVDVARQPSPSDRVMVFKYVIPGLHYDTYEPLTHEHIFLTPFQNIEGLGILLRKLIRYGYENISTSGAYRSLIIRNKLVKDCFSQTYFQKWFGNFSITSVGLQFQYDLKIEFKNIEDELIETIDANPMRAADIIDELGGNVFLVGGIDFALHHQFDKELMLELEHNQHIFKDSATGFGREE